MKRIVLLIVLTISALQGSYAQSDSLKFRQELISTIDLDSVINAQWLNLDNNDTLELVTIYQQQTTGLTTIVRFLPDSAANSIQSDTLSIDLSNDHIHFDDMDNQKGLDIVSFNADQLKIFYHQDSLKYEQKSWTFANMIIESLEAADLTHDGNKEILINGQINGEDRVIILKSTGDDWDVQSIDLDADLLTITPFEDVGTPKIISFGNDSIYVHSFSRDKEIVLDLKQPFLSAVSVVHRGDLNGNQQLDLVLTAEEVAGSPETFIYYDFNQRLIPESAVPAHRPDP